MSDEEVIQVYEEGLSISNAIDSLSMVKFRDGKVEDQLKKIIADLKNIFSSL
ncbi:hypothetical protein SH1V18_48050 [Vallitalea longa]|uniref:Uncharacterized protein n=1 Tax=Vallitalea longa TaxID=2936439 RepID=A0A9W6DH58_9FIRM|nr:hypothetical protein [Vallitalea longa]GKX32325.1 hypothetical protein SH1V18_48050 [Vallitalea longa]